MAILAVDQGTSATKAVVWCPVRGILSEVDVPVAGLSFDGDRIEQDPQALLESVISAGRRALSEAGVNVAAVGIGNQGETVLAWDPSNGRILSSALSWQDRRSHTITDALSHQECERLLALTGLPADPYFAAPKMAWLARQQKLPAGAVVSTIDAFVTYLLTGRYVTDASTASRTQLLDPVTLVWSDVACEIYGLDASTMPTVLACDAWVGTTDAFGPTLPVIGLMVDQQAALLAEGCVSAGMAKATLGTGAFLLANIGVEHLRSTSGLATSIAWAFADGTRASCVDGQVYSAGAGVSWLERVGLITGPGDLDALAMSVADTAGVSFKPCFTGLGAPHWDPGARASIDGLGLSTTPAHLVRAFLAGMAEEIAGLAHAVEADLGHTLRTLRVDGGLTRSQVLMQLLADALGSPVEVYPHSCATALGLAAATIRGLDGPGAEQAIVDGWQPSQIYLPGAG